MAITSVQKLVLPQDTIEVSVEYYDLAEQAKLLKYPTAGAIKSFIANGLEVSTADFLAYYLFHKKRPGMAGWRNFSEIGAKANRAILELEDWVNFNGTSISTPPATEYQVGAITERIGESIGLSVVSGIHKLTGADWDHIPEHAGPKGFSTFDYCIAADDKSIIHLEAKGSSTEDNNVKTSSVSNHKRDIADKKIKISQLEQAHKYPYLADLRYGTITVMGEDPDQPVKCLLVDPPAEGDDSGARRLRLLLRMRFLRDWITFLSPRSQLASALQTRTASLEALVDPYQLSGVPLLKGTGEPFDFTPLRFVGSSSFFANKSTISDGPAGGVCFRLNEDSLLFLGIREDLLQEAANQDFSSLLQKRYETASLQKSVICVFSNLRFRNLGLPTSISERTQRTEGYTHFTLAGTVHYSSSGILFGVLPIPPVE